MYKFLTLFIQQFYAASVHNSAYSLLLTFSFTFLKALDMLSLLCKFSEAENLFEALTLYWPQTST